MAMQSIPGMPIDQSKGSMKEGMKVPMVGVNEPDAKNNGSKGVSVDKNEAK